MNTQLRVKDTLEPGPNGGRYAAKQNTPAEQLESNGLTPAVNTAIYEALQTGSNEDTPTISLLTSSGTAIPSGTLCTDCATPDTVNTLEGTDHGDDTPGTPAWGPSTGNDEVTCIECGRGSEAAAEERLREHVERLRADEEEIAGYTYRAQNFTPARLVEELIHEGRLAPGARGIGAEEALNQLAGIDGVDRDDLYSFDSDEFPKPIDRDQLTVDDIDWLED